MVDGLHELPEFLQRAVSLSLQEGRVALALLCAWSMACTSCPSFGERAVPHGALMQDIAPEKQTDSTTQLLWDFALRRRACAGDISGLIGFEAMNDWHEDLKDHLLSTPPPGYRKVSWVQLAEADKALWRFVQQYCPEGTKMQPGADETEFEKHWVIGMKDARVRAHLAFLQGSSSSGSASPQEAEQQD